MMDTVNAAVLRQLRNQNMYGGLPYFSSPVSYQRGRGLGSLLRGLFRAVRPIFKKPMVRQGLKSLGKAATSAAIEAAQKAMDSDDIKAFGPAFKEASKRNVKTLIRQKMSGKGPTKRKAVSRKPKLTKRGRVTTGRDIFS
jgi:hypothetical protein